MVDNMESISHLLYLVLSFFIAFINSQEFIDNPVRWCVISKPELEKCQALNSELRYYQKNLIDTHKSLTCIQRSNHDECMILLDQLQADVVSLDANEIFLGGRYHSLVPIMKEVYEGNRDSHFSVAIIHKDGKLNTYSNIEDLRGSVACFPSVSSMTGWIVPIATLIKENVMEVIDCNNHVKSASKFFSGGCAVNVLTNKYNPLGDNEMTLCNACGSEAQGVRCSTQDPYAGYIGALKCLTANGDVAFAKHSSIGHAIAMNFTDFPYTVDDFELLCLDGRRVPLSEYMTCNWGEVPSNALATSSAKSMDERDKLQKFLKLLSDKFSEKPNDPKRFYLYESVPRYEGAYDLMVSDDARQLIEVASTKQNFLEFLPPNINEHINRIRSCPVDRMVLCVTSYIEYAKCIKMKTAVDAQLLKPQMTCLNGNSQVGCMVAIKNRQADIALFEAGDIYTAGLNYELIPIMSEHYNLDSSHYYVVAVSGEDDPDTDVAYLRGRYTCHPSIMHGGGWVIPMAYLLNNDLIRGYGCNSIRAASEYFQKSCAPGAMSPTYSYGMDRMNLCEMCRGSLSHYCARDHTEPHFGFTGAFRCLIEGGGQVAFVKHTTVAENTDGKRKVFWARNQLGADYQLLCRDGTRRAISDYEECNLGMVRANAVVTRGGDLQNDTEILAYSKLLLYAQQHFGQNVEDEWNFRLFYSEEPYSDVIFQDSTEQLVQLEREEWHYHPYLGQEFLNARYRVDCAAGVGVIKPTSVVAIVVIAVLTVFHQ